MSYDVPWFSRARGSTDFMSDVVAVVALFCVLVARLGRWLFSTLFPEGHALVISSEWRVVSAFDLLQ